MPQFAKAAAAGGTWLLLDTRTGQRTGRIWETAAADRLIRDGDLAEALAPLLAQPAEVRRASARAALADWTAAGGHTPDFAALALLADNPPGSGTFDGNHHLWLAGAHLGYLDVFDPDTGRDAGLMRYTRLAEDCWAAEQLGTQPERDAALDAALDAFAAAGGLG